MTRRRYTYREVVGIVARQVITFQVGDLGFAGIHCPICDEPILPEQIPDCELDHGIARGLSEKGHEREKDDPANTAFVHGPCHKRKTAADKRRMAKADRQSGKTGQKAKRQRRKEREEAGARPMWPDIHQEQLDRRRLVPQAPRWPKQKLRSRSAWPKGRKMPSRPMRG